jgi:predicted nucleotidyltransferase
MGVRPITSEAEKAGYQVDGIILFGSRARGDCKEESDYDFLIIVNKNISRDEKLNLAWNIRKRLAYYIASDIVIKSFDKLAKEKNDKGLISYYALRDGVMVG